MEIKRELSMYQNYVCPNCFHTLDNCTCETYPPWELINVDKGIQEHVRILNEKGYLTEYSCESHNQRDNIYIKLYDKYDGIANAPAPNGFKYIKSIKVIEHSYNKKISTEDFEEEKKRCLDNLLEWCKNLPERINANKKK